ncbi:type I polyketide synthase loading module domain protein [Mycobacterium ulcerans str. Harvey]|uniref:Type I polyketide synthase loading module domain protein n=1 Tax=Mycobacterium ulcerans str. Harvey TaxID=1299332 RepID=A0ABN0QL39_MYCUL|nr:type I polyketide synthase loading module domain protein [Mycobacterium ulcerans str. Harvey]
MTRLGLMPIATSHGLALFDAALATGQPVSIPARSTPHLARHARDNTWPRSCLR